MPQTSRNNTVRTILYTAALAVITAGACFAASRQHTSLFFSSGNAAIPAAAFFASALCLYLVPMPAVGAGIAAALNIAAAVFCTEHLFLGFPAVVFLLLLFSSDGQKKGNGTVFTTAAVVEAGLFFAALIAAMLRWRTDFSDNERRSLPCAVFLLCIAAFFLYRSSSTNKDKKKKEKTNGKKGAKSSGSDRPKTAYLLGALTAVSAAVYAYATLAVYEAKAYAGIWAVTVFLAELRKRELLVPGTFFQRGDGK